MTRYIRDLIDLPEQVHRGDFVLRLTEGVEHPAETVDSYVVTPQLVEASTTPSASSKRAPAADEQGGLPARQLRQRQEPLHGGAASAAEG